MRKESDAPEASLPADSESTTSRRGGASAGPEDDILIHVAVPESFARRLDAVVEAEARRLGAPVSRERLLDGIVRRGVEAIRSGDAGFLERLRARAQAAAPAPGPTSDVAPRAS